MEPESPPLIKMIKMIEGRIAGGVADCMCMFVTGDMNVDIADVKSVFAKHLKQFCVDSGIVLSSRELLPDEFYLCQ